MYRPLREQARSHNGWRQLSQLNDIQRSICQHLTEFDHLLDTQGKMPARAFQIKGKIAEHGVGRGQGLAEVGQKGFGGCALYNSEQLT